MAIRPLVFTGFPVQAPPAPAPSPPVAGPVSARGSPFAAGLTRAYLSASYGFFPFPAAGGPVDWHPHGSRMRLAPGSAVVHRPPLAHSVAPLAPRAPVRRLRPPAAAAAAPAPVASRLPVRLRRLPPAPSVPVRR